MQKWESYEELGRYLLDQFALRVLEKLLLDRAFQISIDSTSRYQPSLLDTADSLKR